MIMSWLIRSMQPNIFYDFMYNTAAKIWSAVKEMHSKHDNISELYEIKAHLHDLKQGNLVAHKYYTLLKKTWQQIDSFKPHQWSCITDAALYKEITERKQLNPEFHKAEVRF